MVSRACKTGDKTVRAEPIAKPIEGLKTVHNTGNSFEYRV
jgi:hypothetical protein